MKAIYNVIVTLLITQYAYGQFEIWDSSFAKKGLLHLHDINWSTISGHIHKIKDAYYLASVYRDNLRKNKIGIVKFNGEGIIDSAYFNNGFNETDIVLQREGYAFNYNEKSFFSLSNGDILAIYTLIKTTSPNLGSTILDIFKFDVAGKLDLEFGDQGHLIIDEGYRNSGYTFFELTDSSYLVAYNTADSGVSQFNVHVVKFNNLGKIDSSFGSQGLLKLYNKTNIQSKHINIFKGKILISYSTIDSSIVFTRFDFNGKIDSLFEDNGTYKFKLSNSITNTLIQLFLVGGNFYGITIEGIFSLNQDLILRNDFGINGFLSSQSDFFKDFNNHDLYLKSDRFILIGYNTNCDCFAISSLNFNGEPASFENRAWITFTDSLKYAPTQRRCVVYDDVLYVVGTFRNYLKNRNNIVISKILSGPFTVYNEEVEKPTPGLEIYPNPANDILCLNSKNNYYVNTTYDIFNIEGLKVKSFSGNNNCFNINDLPVGTYCLIGRSSTGKIVDYSKFIKL